MRVTGSHVYGSRYEISSALEQVIKPFELVLATDHNLEVCIIEGIPYFGSVSRFLKRFGPQLVGQSISSGLTSEGFKGASELMSHEIKSMVLNYNAAILPAK